MIVRIYKYYWGWSGSGRRGYQRTTLERGRHFRTSRVWMIGGYHRKSRAFRSGSCYYDGCYKPITITRWAACGCGYNDGSAEAYMAVSQSGGTTRTWCWRDRGSTVFSDRGAISCSSSTSTPH